MLPSIPVRLGIETTLAGLGLRLDAVAVLAIAGIYGTSTRSFDLAAGFDDWRDLDAFQFFYLVMPLFRGAYEATGVFYFDFVRLRRSPALREFRLPFFYKLLWTTPVITLFYWGLAVVLGVFVLPDVPFSFLLALLPLFVVRSLIGAYQFRLFAESQFGMLNATIVLSGFLFALVWVDINPRSDLVQITAAMIALLIVHINLQHFQDRKTTLPTLLSLRDWIHTLGPGAFSGARRQAGDAGMDLVAAEIGRREVDERKLRRHWLFRLPFADGACPLSADLERRCRRAAPRDASGDHRRSGQPRQAPGVADGRRKRCTGTGDRRRMDTADRRRVD